MRKEAAVSSFEVLSLHFLGGAVKKQEVLERNNGLLSFNTTRTAQKISVK
jgi:hypothetical protein